MRDARGEGEQVGLGVDQRRSQLADFGREGHCWMVEGPGVIVAVVVHVKVVGVALLGDQTLSEDEVMLSG